jgi:hypothetical protein
VSLLGSHGFNGGRQARHRGRLSVNKQARPYSHHLRESQGDGRSRHA